MSGSGREAFPDVRQLPGDPPGCPGEVGRPCGMSGSPYRMSKSGQKVLPNVRE